ncbi:CHAT domain-containing tetratricopeptide repeat protein [uncultured Aquimarina sp.]|uniref:CHAT domain-containing protein n=1 Tax=uncultured Aquimarina sp. TaxID=575652 RepID=UPI002630F10F|nr:CHAT domain-containing tetratricopeptide repeat protein [uncultured Aquimarina sp.]
MKKSILQFILQLIYFLTITSYSQGISPQLDSIHKLPGTDFEKLDIYQKFLDQYMEQENYTQFGYDAHKLAKWINKEKKTDKAIEIVKMAYEAREIACPFDVRSLKVSYYNYANYNRRKGNLNIAMTYFKKILALGGTFFLKGRTCSIIGGIYDEIGDYHKAITYYTKAFEYYNPEKQLNQIISNRNNLAVSHRNIRSTTSAKKTIYHLTIADSLSTISENPSQKTLFHINNNFGAVYSSESGVRDTEKSIFYLKKALEIAKKNQFIEQLGRVYTNLGVMYIEIDPSKSEEYFHNALSYLPKDSSLLPNVYMGLGLKNIKEQQYLNTQKNFSIAFSYHFGIDTPSIYWLPNENQMKNIVNKAYFLELLKRKLKAWILLAKKENDSSFFSEAIKTAYTCDTLVDLLLKEDISTSSKLLWRNLASEIYIMVLEACYEMNQIEDAFYFMEKSKVLLLMQEVERKKNAVPEEVLEKENRIQNNIIELQKKLITVADSKKDSISSMIFDQKQHLESFVDSLSVEYPKYFTSTTLPPIIKLKDLKLSDNEIILEYVMEKNVSGADFEAYGLLLSNSNTKLFKIDNLKQFEKNIYTLRKQLNRPFKTQKEIQAYKRLSYSIYNSLFPEETQALIQNKKITISADYILNYIPFEALITDIEKNSYLIENTEISYGYSLSFMKENASISRETSQDFLGIAPVQFDDQQTMLSKSSEEIAAANAYYSGQVLTEKEATTTNFKNSVDKFKIIHLATHANASDSLNPWIAFRNKKLYHLELNTLKNNADLVVLSACNTSLGEVRSGEGIMSLARGFFKSGAKSVIPSLWSTNDKATATITSDFYKNLSEGKTKSAALRTAKLNYLHNNTDAEASPHYWASLVLIGDSGTLLPQSNNLLFLWIGLGLVLILIILYILFLRKKKK